MSRCATPSCRREPTPGYKSCWPCYANWKDGRDPEQEVVRLPRAASKHRLDLAIADHQPRTVDEFERDYERDFDDDRRYIHEPTPVARWE